MDDRDYISDRLKHETLTCPTGYYARVPCDLVDELTKLLKKYEPIAPTIATNSRGWTYMCGACGAEMVTIRDTVSANYARKNNRYCQRCGRAVKWE